VSRRPLDWTTALPFVEESLGLQARAESLVRLAKGVLIGRTFSLPHGEPHGRLDLEGRKAEVADVTWSRQHGLSVLLNVYRADGNGFLDRGGDSKLRTYIPLTRLRNDLQWLAIVAEEPQGETEHG